MCYNRSYFSDFIESLKNIRLANGDKISSSGYGSISCSVNDLALTLKNVLYVPSLISNLLYISALANLGHNVNFRNKACKISLSGSEKELKAKQINSLFVISLKCYPSSFCHLTRTLFVAFKIWTFTSQRSEAPFLLCDDD